MAGKQADIKVGVITNYDDKGIKSAETGLKGFSNSIKDADGVGGKFAAGWGNIKSQVSAHAGALAVGAGAALVAFGVKAVGAFTDTAKAALDLSTATGLSTEQASRWIAVGDDFEVTAEALQTGLGKIAKTLDDEKWGTYGIATRDAGGEARSTNDILLDSFDMLSKVTNETDRARIGQQLFGKGYQSLTPILGKTRGEYEKMLGSVEKGQVITAQEAAKAERFRLAQDQLGDAFQDVTIAIGEQVAALAPLLEKAAQLVMILGTTAEESSDYGNELATLAEQYGLTTKQQNDYFESIYTGKQTIEQVRAEIVKTSDSLRDQEKSWETQTGLLEKVAAAEAETERETRALGRGFDAVKPPVDETTGAIKNFERSLADADLAYQRLTGELDEADAWENVVTKIGEAGNAAKLTGQDARDLTRDIADYVTTTNTIPASKKTEILAALRDGDIAKAEMLLADLTRTREIYLALTGPGAVTAAGFDGGISGRRAAGGPVTKGNWLVGEQGPEIVHMGGNGSVSNATDTAAMLGGGGGVTNNYITLNAGLGTDVYAMAKQLVNVLAYYDRHNATNIVTPASR